MTATSGPQKKRFFPIIQAKVINIKTAAGKINSKQAILDYQNSLNPLSTQDILQEVSHLIKKLKSGSTPTNYKLLKKGEVLMSELIRRITDDSLNLKIHVRNLRAHLNKKMSKISWDRDGDEV